MSASLEFQARDFATELTQTVQSLVRDADPFEAQVLTRRDGSEVFTVKQHPGDGIALAVNGQPLLRITVEYFCSLDRADAFLAVDRSKVAVYAYAEGAREPLFRYEYERSATDSIPGAHLQFHAHRNDFAFVMARAGTSTSRGSRRSVKSAVPNMSEIHFPLGGHRFRPCLEDILAMLVWEFGLDCPEGALEALANGREAWRRKQVRSAVRDAPSDAVEALRALGFAVTAPGGAVPDNRTRLREL